MLALSVTHAAPMPSVDAPMRTGLSASGDAAVVIGVGDYPRLGPGFKVDYAEEDALAFNDFLIYTRGVPSNRVHYLNALAGKEEIAKTFKNAASQATGTLWFYFAGHGAADPKTKEQVLLPADLPIDSELQQARMLPISDLQKIARDSKAKNTIFVIDACHAQLESTRFLAPTSLLSLQTNDRMVIWTAAQAGQLSKPIPSTKHGAFTYAVLRALRGDADGEISGVKDGIVDLNEADQFVNQFLKRQKLYSSQTPQLNRPQKFSCELSNVKHARIEAPAPAPSSAIAEFKGGTEASPQTSGPVIKPAVEALYQKARKFEELSNQKQAAVYYQKAAKKGHPAAQFKMGQYASHGWGDIPQNHQKAAEWYLKAAEQGNAEAQYNLGLCYRREQGVPRNYQKAAKWYSEAAEQGYAPAQTLLGYCYKNGEGVPRNFQKAIKWYLKAAEQGYAKAQYQLGVCYDEGEGVPRSLEKAYEWYKKAADQGYEDAIKALR